MSYNNLSGRTPKRVAQFAIFDESNYRDNLFLRGWPMPLNFIMMVSPSSISRSSIDDEESNCFIDMGVFYMSFGVTYVMVLLANTAVLFIYPYWRRV